MLGKLNQYQIEQLLQSQTYGHLGCHSDGRTYVVPVSYVYDSGKVYGYTIDGLKVTMMRKNPEICFQVELIEDAAHWQSVILWGKFRELEGMEADEAVQLFSSRLHPFRTSETSRPKHGLEQVKASYNPGSRMVAFEISIDEKTGRFEKQ